MTREMTLTPISHTKSMLNNFQNVTLRLAVK